MPKMNYFRSSQLLTDYVYKVVLLLMEIKIALYNNITYLCCTDLAM